MKRILTFGLIATLVLGAAACTRTQKGGVIGAGTGAVLGGIIGERSGNTAAGAIIGAAVGGAAGAYIGNYMDKQAEEMQQDLKNAKVERVGEGIKITFDSGILFDVNKADLRPAAQSNLNELAGILQKYEDTNILIEGHTDSTGGEDHNLELSQRRAQSVVNYLIGQSVKGGRIQTQGWGEAHPVASNDTEAGRQANRRVELAIWANEKLKKAAEANAAG